MWLIRYKINIIRKPEVSSQRLHTGNPVKVRESCKSEAVTGGGQYSACFAVAENCLLVVYVCLIVYVDMGAWQYRQLGSPAAP